MLPPRSRRRKARSPDGPDGHFGGSRCQRFSGCGSGRLRPFLIRPRPSTMDPNHHTQHEHTDGDGTDQDGRVRDPAQEEYSGRTKSNDDKSEQHGQDPRVCKIPRPAYDEAVSNNDTWVGSTCINDTELPILFVISQCFGFFPSHLSPQERVKDNGCRVSTFWYELQSYTSGAG